MGAGERKSTVEPGRFNRLDLVADLPERISDCSVISPRAPACAIIAYLPLFPQQQQTG